MKAQKAVRQEREPAVRIADRIGTIKAQINQLTKEYDFLKSELIDQGGTVFDGDIYRVTLTATERNTLDMKAVREKLSPQFIAAHTNTTKVVQLHVSALDATNIVPIK